MQEALAIEAAGECSLVTELADTHSPSQGYSVLLSDSGGPSVGVPVTPSRMWFFHTPACSRQLHMAAFMGCFGFGGFLELAKGNIFLPDYPGSHCLRFTFLLALSLRGCTCSQHWSWNSSSPELRLEGSRILPRMRSRVPVPAERWLHVTSPTTPQIKTHPPRSFAINRRIL